MKEKLIQMGVVWGFLFCMAGLAGTGRIDSILLVSVPEYREEVRIRRLPVSGADFWDYLDKAAQGAKPAGDMRDSERIVHIVLLAGGKTVMTVQMDTGLADGGVKEHYLFYEYQGAVYELYSDTLDEEEWQRFQTKYHHNCDVPMGLWMSGELSERPDWNTESKMVLRYTWLSGGEDYETLEVEWAPEDTKLLAFEQSPDGFSLSFWEESRENGAGYRGCYRLRKYSPDAFEKENPEIAAAWYPGKRDALVAAFRNRYPHMDMLKIYSPAGWKAEREFYQILEENRSEGYFQRWGYIFQVTESYGWQDAALSDRLNNRTGAGRTISENGQMEKVPWHNGRFVNQVCRKAAGYAGEAVFLWAEDYQADYEKEEYRLKPGKEMPWVILMRPGQDTPGMDAAAKSFDESKEALFVLSLLREGEQVPFWHTWECSYIKDPIYTEDINMDGYTDFGILHFTGRNHFIRWYCYSPSEETFVRMPEE